MKCMSRFINFLCDMNSGGGTFAAMPVRAESSQCESAISTTISVIYVFIRGWECRNVVSENMNGGRGSGIHDQVEIEQYIIRQNYCIYQGSYYRHPDISTTTNCPSLL